MIQCKPKWPWRDHLTEEERQIIETGDAAKAEWLRLSLPRQRIMNRALQRAKFAAMNRAPGALALLASVSCLTLPARADDLRVPLGMILCHSMQAVASLTKGGCWRAAGGQQVEIIARLPHYAQLRLWSTDRTETSIAWSMAADADQLQVRR